MDLFIFSLGFLGFIACLITLIIFAFKRKKKKTVLLSLGLSFTFMVVGLSMPHPENTATDKNITASKLENNETVAFVKTETTISDSEKNSKLIVSSDTNITTKSLAKSIPNLNVKDEKTSETPILPFSQTLKVHFLDVGQADSILIEMPNNKNILIDAGNNGDSTYISSYIRILGIKQFDLVIGTHPHEDHIGSLDTVINNYDVKQIIMPKVSATTKTFEDVLTSIASKNLKITTPVPGQTYIYDDAKLTILAPNSSEYADVNNYSVVAKLEYGENSFLFTGDAEDISENEILLNKFDIKSDVLKVGHHGSNSSTTSEFLKAVNPKYAVISCGKDNQYGHPGIETIDLLNSNNINIYRTDEAGAIVAISDGKNLTINKNKSTIKINAPPIIKTTETKTTTKKIEVPSDAKYIGNKNSHKLHTLDCSYASKINTENREYFSDVETAHEQGYEPCGHCTPFVLHPWRNTIVTDTDSTSSEKYVEKKDTSNTSPMYVGSKNSDKFHKLSCSSAKRIKNANLRYFYSRQEAINAGYVPCKRCNP